MTTENIIYVNGLRFKCVGFRIYMSKTYSNNIFTLGI